MFEPKGGIKNVFQQNKRERRGRGTRSQSLGIPNLTDSPSVYSAVNAELTNVQCFLDRCHKRRYISRAVNIYSVSKNQDRKIFDKVKHQEKHPLRNLIRKLKVTEYNLEQKFSHLAKLNTDREKNSYFNHLIFKYDLAL